MIFCEKIHSATRWSGRPLPSAGRERGEGILNSMEREAKIYVAGHQGLAGAAILRRLQADGFQHLVVRTFQELDLRDQAAVTGFFARERPAYVFLAAARVGGIRANDTFPAEFIYDNLMIEANVIHQAYRHEVKKLLFLGSSCSYPRLCPQPMQEDSLLDGKLDPTNEPYAVAKIAGIKLCQSYNRQYGTCFISVMPDNLYGPGDNFDLQNSHVIAALIRRFHQARAAGDPEVVVWGTGTPRRAFLYVDDLADACLFLMERYQDGEIINVGVGQDVQILDLARQVAAVTGYPGQIVLDPNAPDGAPRKLLDVSRLTAMGWQAQTPLAEGLKKTYDWFCRSPWAGKS
jgi:GDP-L-fucose synthase